MTDPTPNDDAPATRTVTPMQRILMDRARAQAERDRQKPTRSPLQIAGSMVLALAAVLIVFGAINAFLAAMQRAMHQMDEQEKAQEAKREAEQRKAPIPAYVVPEEAPKK
jgi:hypothetical protein